MSSATAHDNCFKYGNYNEYCDCNTCEHRDQCSGSEEKEETEEE